MMDVFNNYNKYLIKSKQLQMYTKGSFSFDKMKDKLEGIITKILSDVPKQVGIKLPKLQKTNSNKIPEVKLPKLKKA